MQFHYNNTSLQISILILILDSNYYKSVMIRSLYQSDLTINISYSIIIGVTNLNFLAFTTAVEVNLNKKRGANESALS